MAVRPQQYWIQFPVDTTQVENINSMFESLFKAMRNGNIDIATGQITAGVLGVAHGGTGLSSYSIGDMLYASAATTLSKLALGATGYWLQAGATAPTWTAPAAITRVNDTNVTLTLGGSATTALLNTASLTLGWTGTLAVPRGGIGVGTLALNGVLYGNGTSAVLALAVNATATNKYLQQTSSNAPVWSTIPASEITNGQALTKTDDTNVTLTLGGSPSTALLAATSLTLGWTGVLSIARGGTNSSTALSGSSIMISDGTHIVQGTAGTTTTVLHGNAAGAPTYGAVTLTTDVTGVLPIANGGTNVSSQSTNGVCYFDGTKITSVGSGGSSRISWDGTTFTDQILGTGSGQANLMFLQKLQQANDTGFYLNFRSGTSATTSQGQFGVTHHGTGGDTIITGEAADYLAMSGTNGIQFGVNAVLGMTLTSSGLSLSGFTLGSVLFSGTSGLVSQDNANLFWDGTNHRLGISTNTSLLAQLDILSGSAIAAIHVGPDSGGGYIYSAVTNNLSFVEGATVLSGVYTAKATDSSQIHLGGGNVEFFQNSGLTIGNTFVPTLRAYISAGQFLFSNGSAAAPSITGINFTTTGLHFTGDPGVSVDVGGSQIALFTATGLGIGVTPTQKLSVSGSINTVEGDLLLQHGTTNNVNMICVFDGSSASDFGPRFQFKRNGVVKAQIGTESTIQGGTSDALDIEDATGIFLNIGGGNVGLGAAAVASALLSINEKLLLTSAGLVSKYNNIATTGWGVPAVYGYGRSPGATGAVSPATYTVGAVDGSFLVSANVLITSSTAFSFTVTCTYTDEGGTVRTLTLNFSQVSGTFVQTLTNILGAGAYEGVLLHIRAKASTTITIATTGTFTNVTYNIDGCITQIA